MGDNLHFTLHTDIAELTPAYLTVALLKPEWFA